MRALLTPAQNERLSREYRRRDSRPVHAIKTQAEKPYTLGNTSDDLINFDDSPKKNSGKPATPSDVHLVEVFLNKIHFIIRQYLWFPLFLRNPIGRAKIINIYPSYL